MLQSQQECSCTQGSPDIYFKIKNCFSELTSEVQKANARYNLGIGDKWNLKWGNITGFIENQADLVQYLDKFIANLEEFKQELRNLVEDKAKKALKDAKDYTDSKLTWTIFN